MNIKKILILAIIFSFLCWAPILAADPSVIKLDNPLTIQTDSPAVLIGYVIQAVLGIVGGVALVMMVYGGFQWLTAAGNEEKVKGGTQTMLWSAIGLILVFSSYIIAKTVLGVIYG